MGVFVLIEHICIISSVWYIQRKEQNFQTSSYYEDKKQECHQGSELVQQQTAWPVFLYANIVLTVLNLCCQLMFNGVA